jgi:hypothetical protein
VTTLPASSAAAPDGPTPSRPANGPLVGVVVLDLASVGPAARCTRVLADYGATVVKVGAVPGRGVEPLRPPFYAYSGARHLQHGAPTWWSRAFGPGSWTVWVSGSMCFDPSTLG